MDESAKPKRNRAEIYRGVEIENDREGYWVGNRWCDTLFEARWTIDRQKEAEPRPRDRRGLRLPGALALVALVGGGVWWLLREDSLPVNSHEQPVRGEARLACRDHIAERLHDPESAQWGELADWLATAPEDGEITVWMRYRARNSFGALVLSRETCRVEVRDNGTVRVRSVGDFL